MTTAGLARMNMILHDFPTASILTGNTLADAEVQGRRAAAHLRLRGRQPAVLGQDLEHRPDPGERSVPALRLGRAAGQAGRLRLPAAHHPLA